MGEKTGTERRLRYVEQERSSDNDSNSLAIVGPHWDHFPVWDKIT